MTKHKHTSRYEKVQWILSKAQGEDCPDYDGYHRFWERPHKEFISMVLYGIRMIVFDGDDIAQKSGSSHSCCHST